MADLSRRRLLQASMLVSGAMLLPGVMQAAWAAGQISLSRIPCVSGLSPDRLRARGYRGPERVR